jgi:cephalosporin-C deacetylase
MPSNFPHPFSFDPGYGYELDELLAVTAPEAPPDFVDFWQARYGIALSLPPRPRLNEVAGTDTPGTNTRWKVARLTYESSGGFRIHGWAIFPREGEIRRGLVFVHGYGGLQGPDLTMPYEDAVIFFPCLRGISLSRRPPISSDPHGHVLHGINDRDHYILRGCTEDLWIGVSAMLELFPQVSGHLGLIGISFGGGIAALATPWDPRIVRTHLEVPTFGHHPLRLTLPTLGSGAAVTTYEKYKGGTLDTLRYYDAATAARHITVPVHVAAARFDPYVAPPGQFAIYNALGGPRELFVLDAGHFDYPDHASQHRILLEEKKRFFSFL